MSNTENNATIAQLREQMKAIEAEIAERRSNAVSELRAEFDKRLEDMELNIADIYPELNKPRRAPRGSKQNPAAAEAMHKNPNGPETWSGRGRVPKWFEELAEKEGVTVAELKGKASAG
jgi:DNA-binding protein H-NS